MCLSHLCHQDAGIPLFITQPSSLYCRHIVHNLFLWVLLVYTSNLLAYTSIKHHLCIFLTELYISAAHPTHMSRVRKFWWMTRFVNSSSSLFERIGCVSGALVVYKNGEYRCLFTDHSYLSGDCYYRLLKRKMSHWTSNRILFISTVVDFVNDTINIYLSDRLE